MSNFRQMIADAADRIREEEQRPISTDQPTDDKRETYSLSNATLYGLQLMGHVYGGTVPPEVVAKRRAKNRHARRARRGNTAAIRRQARSNRVANRFNRFGYAHNMNPLGRVIEAEVVDE
ncbi:hypothetical protein SEA_BIPPER_55 [Mycobacterium phage Bipper]|uniref:Uncharacterized protein n=1 Tax=Mycobacterium phage Bipper TaxID=1805457 RepID=A0A142F2I3_9CAUD|nr:hypothetical protein KCH39_gp122 [Mycobacterium phage Bipper]AMQ66990.1 hypothetical protein SEA_BIPPER_55 [Mycobacterium phage Bipper]